MEGNQPNNQGLYLEVPKLNLLLRAFLEANHNKPQFLGEIQHLLEAFLGKVLLDNQHQILQALEVQVYLFLVDLEQVVLFSAKHNL